MNGKRMTTGNGALIKSMNKQLILDCLMFQEPVSRTYLAEQTGLTMPTIMRIVDGFIEDGLVFEQGKGDSSGGRKPIMIQISPDAVFFLGTDVSRECHSLVIDIDGKIYGKAQCKIDYSQSEAHVTAQIRDNMNRAIEKSHIPPSKIAYSGIGLPGTNFKFLQNTNLSFQFWSDVVKERLEKQLQIGYPTIMENVGRLGAVAELRFGLGRNLQDFIYIYADEGIGAGVVINGALETGIQGVGCEFGHTTINFQGQLCYCGSRGCLETYCSSYALLREYEVNLLNEGLMSVMKNQTPFFDLLCAVESGNPLATDAVKKAGSTLGVGIGNLINLYNPQAIIMGGELCQTIPSYTEVAIKEAKKRIFIRDAYDVKFMEASVDRNSEALGAAALAASTYFEEYCLKQ